MSDVISSTHSHAIGGITSNRPVLAIEGLTVSFDGFKAVDDLNLYVDRNEVRVVIGPNGAGKTTVLDLICGKTAATCRNSYMPRTRAAWTSFSCAIRNWKPRPRSGPSRCSRTLLASTASSSRSTTGRMSHCSPARTFFTWDKATSPPRRRAGCWVMT